MGSSSQLCRKRPRNISGQWETSPILALRFHIRRKSMVNSLNNLAYFENKHRYQVSSLHWNCTSKKHQETTEVLLKPQTSRPLAKNHRLMPFSRFGQIQQLVCMGHLPSHGGRGPKKMPGCTKFIQKAILGAC